MASHSLAIAGVAARAKRIRKVSKVRRQAAPMASLSKVNACALGCADELSNTIDEL